MFYNNEKQIIVKYRNPFQKVCCHPNELFVYVKASIINLKAMKSNAATTRRFGDFPFSFIERSYNCIYDVFFA